MMSAFWKKTTLALMLGAWMVSCVGKPVNEADPKEMYEDAEIDIEGNRYLLALDKLRVVRSKFSYSNYGALAQLRIGDVYFLQDSFPEAAVAYEGFYELYPKHAKASYALFRAGESHYSDIPTTTARDLKSAENAIQWLGTYLARYPRGEHSERARDLRQKAYDKLAEKELDTARFYLKRKKYPAARTRLEKLLELYPGSAYADQAREMLEGLPE
jgi:outer membrane protein assembly factor BamD